MYCIKKILKIFFIMLLACSQNGSAMFGILRRRTAKVSDEDAPVLQYAVTPKPVPSSVSTESSSRASSVGTVAVSAPIHLPIPFDRYPQVLEELLEPNFLEEGVTHFTTKAFLKIFSKPDIQRPVLVMFANKISRRLEFETEFYGSANCELRMMHSGFRSEQKPGFLIFGTSASPESTVYFSLLFVDGACRRRVSFGLKFTGNKVASYVRADGIMNIGDGRRLSVKLSEENVQKMFISKFMNSAPESIEPAPYEWSTAQIGVDLVIGVQPFTSPIPEVVSDVIIIVIADEKALNEHGVTLRQTKST